MKYIRLNLLCLLCTGSFVFCFSDASRSQSYREQSFGQGTNVLSLAYGVQGASSSRGMTSDLNYFYGNPGIVEGNFNYSGLGPFSLAYERGITRKLGIGYFGLGGRITYCTDRFSLTHQQYDSLAFGFETFEVDYQVSMLDLAARAAYHFDLYSNKLDFYLGASAGVTITTLHADISEITPDFNFAIVANGVPFNYSLFAGSRFYFTDKFGMHAEVSWGITFVSAGINLRI